MADASFDLKYVKAGGGFQGCVLLSTLFLQQINDMPLIININFCMVESTSDAFYSSPSSISRDYVKECNQVVSEVETLLTGVSE